MPGLRAARLAEAGEHAQIGAEHAQVADLQRAFVGQ